MKSPLRQERFTERQESPARIEAFTDGVTTVALTLLVLDLRVPAIPGEVTNAAVWHAVGSLAPKMLVFLASFVIIGFFWIGHHLIFWAIERSNRWLMWLNLAFLFPLVCLPFSTSLAGEYTANGAAATIYMIDVVVTGYLARAIWLYAVSAKLISPSITADYIRAMNRRLLLVMAVLCGVAVFAPFFPVFSIAGMVVAIAYVVVTTGQRAIVDRSP